MRMYWTELRRSPLRWWLPVLIAVDLAGMLLRDRFWIGVWPEASAAAQVPAIFLASAIGAAGAWISGGVYRSGMVENISGAAKQVWRAELVRVASTVTYGLLAYLPGVLLAGVLSMPQAGPGTLWPGYLLLGMSQILLSAVIGHLVGRWAHSPLVAPIGVALGLYIGLMLLETFAGIRFLTLFGPVQEEVSRSAVAVRLALASGVLAVLLVSPTRFREKRWKAGRRRLLTIPATAVLLVGAMVGTLMTPELTERRPAPSDKLCTPSVPTFCVWPEHRKYLPQLTTMAQRLTELPTKELVVPSGFDEEWVTGRDPLIAWREFYFRIIEGSIWSVSPTVSMAVLESSKVKPSCGLNTLDDEGWRTAYFEVMTWLEARINGTVQPDDVQGAPPGVNPKVVGRLIAEPEEVQARWVEERVRKVRETPCA